MYATANIINIWISCEWNVRIERINCSGHRNLMSSLEIKRNGDEKKNKNEMVSFWNGMTENKACCGHAFKYCIRTCMTLIYIWFVCLLLFEHFYFICLRNENSAANEFVQCAWVRSWEVWQKFNDIPDK